MNQATLSVPRGRYGGSCSSRPALNCNTSAASSGFVTPSPLGSPPAEHGSSERSPALSWSIKAASSGFTTSSQFTSPACVSETTSTALSIRVTGTVTGSSETATRWVDRTPTSGSTNARTDAPSSAPASNTRCPSRPVPTDPGAVPNEKHPPAIRPGSTFTCSGKQEAAGREASSHVASPIPSRSPGAL